LSFQFTESINWAQRETDVGCHNETPQETTLIAWDLAETSATQCCIGNGHAELRPSIA